MNISLEVTAMKLFLYILIGIVISYILIALGTVGFIIGIGIFIGLFLRLFFLVNSIYKKLSIDSTEETNVTRTSDTD
ncbi:hypothetical protein SAMN05444162_3535 [Paenibacillaceae bacterium GAS479]|nr:hypothetical protein SAMN05444162_3535 [Paenibacillaceae bacterium GAS479]